MKVDLILKNAWVYRTYRQCFEKMDIAVAGEKFYDISPAVSYSAEKTVDCEGQYIIPGLIDIHMHIESSMTYPEEFSRTVLPYGVTCVVADPHEIANVFGIEGIRSFMNQKTELDIFYAIPSSVPATNSRIETSGETIGEDAVRELLKDERVICLGEVMNYKDLTSEEDTLIKRIIGLCKENERQIKIEGHCPSLTGEDCARFIFAGVDADHTKQTPESILEKTDMGMFLELQAKSLSKEVVEIINRYKLYENIALVTDDTMPDYLSKGQLDRVIRLAVKNGMPIEKAIYCSTLTPARRMHLDGRGIIAPGKLADFVILKDLDSLCPAAVYKNGKKYKETSRPVEETRIFPDYFYSSVKCRLAVAADFNLNLAEQMERFSEGCEFKNGTAVVNVMQIQPFDTNIQHVSRTIQVKNGQLCWQESDLNLIAIFERYGKSGSVSYGFAEKALTKQGAVATTWSHDSHNLLVIGNSVEDMVAAQNAVVSMQGGYVTASGGMITASADLFVGGIISHKSIPELAEELGRVREAIKDMGYVNNNAIMSISTLALLVSPELKISDKGMFDVKTQQKVPLVEMYEDDYNKCNYRNNE